MEWARHGMADGTVRHFSMVSEQLARARARARAWALLSRVAWHDTKQVILARGAVTQAYLCVADGTEHRVEPVGFTILRCLLRLRLRLCQRLRGSGSRRFLSCHLLLLFLVLLLPLRPARVPDHNVCLDSASGSEEARKWGWSQPPFTHLPTHTTTVEKISPAVHHVIRPKLPFIFDMLLTVNA